MLIDLVFRAAAVAFFLATAATLLLRYRDRAASVSSALLCVGLTAYLVGPYLLTPDRQTLVSFFVLALAIANGPLIWLTARRLFRERPLSQSREAMAVVGATAIGLTFAYELPQKLFGYTPLVKLGCTMVPQGVALIFVILAIIEAQRDAHQDLVESRRRLRVFFVTAIATYAAFVLVTEIALRGEPAPDALNLVHVGLLASAAVAGAVLVFKHGDSLFGALPAPREEQPTPAPAELASSRDGGLAATALPQPPPPDPLQAALEAWIARRGYLEPEQSVAQLAKTLRTQEYKLRRLLNSQLGFRNFNEFLHRHRIGVACEMLRERRDLSILALSMEVGYRSLATFNRAFKDVTGVSPTEYRARQGVKY